LAYDVAAFDLLVPPDCRLLGGWKISASGLAIPPLLVGIDLENIIHRHRNELSEEDHNDPNFAADSDLWPAILADECLAALEAFRAPSTLPFTIGPVTMLAVMDEVSGRSPPPSENAS
jgi:hypothetical protein